MKHYFNEFDAKAAAWIRELMKAGLIPQGDVDERSIEDVDAGDLVGYDSCHFFAGVSGWSLALRFAGWPDDRPVWTGSCPCPPFSAAGKKKRCPECGGRPVPCPRRTGYFICLGCEHAWFADGRHLWPEFWRLIRDRRPPVIFGEQVSGADGRLWLAGVRASLGRIGYATGAADLPALGVGSPHIRQRLFWVADAGRGVVRGDGRVVGGEAGGVQGTTREQRVRSDAGDGRDSGGMGDAGSGDDEHDARGIPGPERATAGRGGNGPRGPGVAGRVGDTERPERRADEQHEQLSGRRVEAAGGLGGPGDSGRADGVALGDTIGPGLEVGVGDPGVQRRAGRPPEGQAPELRGDAGVWRNSRLIHCRDGKVRRVPGCPEPGVLGLVDGLPAELVPVWLACHDGYPLVAEKVPGRVGLLKGYGNAICPQVAAEFVRAWGDSRLSQIATTEPGGGG